MPSIVLRFYKYVMEFSPQLYKIGAIVIPIYQMKKLKFKERNRLVQEYTVSKRQSLDWIHSAALQGPAPYCSLPQHTAAVLVSQVRATQERSQHQP